MVLNGIDLDKVYSENGWKMNGLRDKRSYDLAS